MESNEVLKETALLYLSDALIKQSFEECAQLIELAKQFGALESEVSEAITDYLEGRKTGGLNGANAKTNRLGITSAKGGSASG